MTQAVFVRAIELSRHTPDEGCRENYGWCGGHAAFLTGYVCDCGAVIVLDQCAAWPITDTDCPKCFARVSCEIPCSATTANLR